MGQGNWDITYGYGESGFRNPERDSALTSVLGTEFISKVDVAAASTLGLETVLVLASAFCTVLTATAGSETLPVGAGRALLSVEDGRKALPIC